MAFAVAKDVQDRLTRDLDENEARIVTTRLADAELLITDKIPDLTDRVATGVLSKKTVVMVESDMVLRLIRNPEGYTQESDGNYSYMISSQVASGRLEVTDTEWHLLGVRRGAFTLTPYQQHPVRETDTWT
ncbi:Gp19/Gp15/Gp42 family protein [Actinocrispum wychmicini]|uniref:Gp19/Gp15/Gp42-like protein n=1 Tax=Actinocrispum wychmicini TaxID=1213861 RepID=A0A4R2JDA8_9PSEU|nr:Gp19/Gp15/Gp42 family protein [Actinocrispum wychmicini]TCO56904.1 Gp19/Gp15/Gp42-like protein [Actinocrispum wychmicini]